MFFAYFNQKNFSFIFSPFTDCTSKQSKQKQIFFSLVWIDNIDSIVIYWSIDWLIDCFWGKNKRNNDDDYEKLMPFLSSVLWKKNCWNSHSIFNFKSIDFSRYLLINFVFYKMEPHFGKFFFSYIFAILKFMKINKSETCIRGFCYHICQSKEQAKNWKIKIK